jgi:hypothetical protein
MRLFYQDEELGTIQEVVGEQPWMSGTFVASPNVDRYRGFFGWMVDEDNGGKEPPFDASLLDENNWFIVEDSGRRRGIGLPAVHPDGLIMWRWR